MLHRPQQSGRLHSQSHCFFKLFRGRDHGFAVSLLHSIAAKLRVVATLDHIFTIFFGRILPALLDGLCPQYMVFRSVQQDLDHVGRQFFGRIGGQQNQPANPVSVICSKVRCHRSAQ